MAFEPMMGGPVNVMGSREATGGHERLPFKWGDVRLARMRDGEVREHRANAVPFNFGEALEPSPDWMNRRGCRVRVSGFPGRRVPLVKQ